MIRSVLSCQVAEWWRLNIRRVFQKPRTSKNYINNKFVIIPAVVGGFYGVTWGLLSGLDGIINPQKK